MCVVLATCTVEEIQKHTLALFLSHTLPILSLSLSVLPFPLKNSFLYKWFSHTANINI